MAFGRLARFVSANRGPISLALVLLTGLGLAVGWARTPEPLSLWEVWKIRCGGMATRRATLDAIRSAELQSSFTELWAEVAGDDTVEPTNLVAGRGRIRTRRLFPVIVEVAERDSDPTCRARAIAALLILATRYGTSANRAEAVGLALCGCRDPAAEVRVAGLGSLAPLAALDRAAIAAALHAGQDDSDPTVRLAAVRAWAALGVLDKVSRREASAVLAEVSARSPEASLREAAVWSLGSVGADHSRVAGSDMAPSLVHALADPVARVRLAAATILSRTTLDQQHQTISAWRERRDELIGSLRATLGDPDPRTRVHAALALSWLGDRDEALRLVLEEASTDSPEPTRADCQAALTTWHLDKSKLPSN